MAETATIALGGFEERQQLVALDLFEIGGLDAGAAAKRRPLRFAAHRAVAIARAGQRAGNPVLDTATEAAAVDHVNFPKYMVRAGKLSR